MHVPDRYRDLIEYLSFAGARFDVDVGAVSAHPPWFSRLGTHRHDAGEAAPAIDVETCVARTLPDAAYVLVVVPAGRMPTERELQDVLGPCEWIGAEETLAVTEGLPPGTLPPFGWPYLPGISKVFLDREIAAAPAIAFKAAALDRTVHMTGRDYKGVLGDFALLG